MIRTTDTEQLLATKKHVPLPAATPMTLANKDLYKGVALHHPAPRTSYRDSYGAFGVDPRTNLPQDPAETNFRASTAENFLGTTKASYHPPGYSGFVPETGKNPLAMAHGVCPKPREGTKNFRLSTLFQYPHQIPGYGGYRPITAINDQEPVRDESATTMSRFMADGSNRFQPGDLGLSMSTLAKTAPMRSQYGKQGALYQEIFSQESIDGNLSDNGRNEAETYYHRTRPMEGRSVAIIKQGHWSQMG